MFPGPVFLRELNDIARRLGSYRRRAAYGLLLLTLLVTIHAVTFPARVNGASSARSIREMARFALSTFIVFSLVQMLAIVAALVAGAIAEESHRKTLDLLLASRLGSDEIVLGKLGGRLIQAGTLLVISLPIIVLLLTMPNQGLIGLLLIACAPSLIAFPLLSYWDLNRLAITLSAPGQWRWGLFLVAIVLIPLIGFGYAAWLLSRSAADSLRLAARPQQPPPVDRNVPSGA